MKHYEILISVIILAAALLLSSCAFRRDTSDDIADDLEEKILTGIVTEVMSNSFLVRSDADSSEFRSSDLFDISVVNADPSNEPQKGDRIEVRYTGDILETYPASLENITGIRVLKKDVSRETADGSDTLIPDASGTDEHEASAVQEPVPMAIMHGGNLYVCSGKTADGIQDHFCIFLTISSCSESELPSVDQQCNFSPDKSVRYQLNDEEKTLTAELPDGSFAIFEIQPDTELISTVQPYFITMTCYVEKVFEDGSFIVTPGKASQEYGVHDYIFVERTTDGSIPSVGEPYEVHYRGKVSDDDPADIEELLSAVRMGFTLKK